MTEKTTEGYNGFSRSLCTIDSEVFSIEAVCNSAVGYIDNCVRLPDIVCNPEPGKVKTS